MHIASVEDDPEQAMLIRSIVTTCGYECTTFPDGESFLRQLSAGRFDLLLLDRELPDFDGLTLLSRARLALGMHVPMLFITSHACGDEIVSGLEAGADDYIVKPFRRGELVARIESQIRRAGLEQAWNRPATIGAYRIHFRERRIEVRQADVVLTAKEYDVAMLLFKNLGRVVSREYMIQTIWGRELGALSRTVDTHVSRVRHKLQLVPANGVSLTSIYAHGYRLDLTEALSNCGAPVGDARPAHARRP